MGVNAEAAAKRQEGFVLAPLLGGMLGVAVSMGIGRFAYTPLLPMMQNQFHFSASFAGLLASVNNFGYLAGALLISWLPKSVHQNRVLCVRLVIVALAGIAMGTGAMAATESHRLWAVLRGIVGVFSAVVYILLSSLLMDWLAQHRKLHKMGLFYGGTGVGITLTGILVPLSARFGDWRFGWVSLGAASVLLIVIATFVLRPLWRMADGATQTSPVVQQESDTRSPFRLWGIGAAYGLAGLGYIVMATFIAAFFRHVGNAAWLSDVSWIAVGVAAAVSTSLWAQSADRLGLGPSTYLVYLGLAAGVLLPVVWPGITTAIVGAVLFGGTFMGIAMLALSIGRQCDPANAGRIIGVMTVVFSVGQVLGPVGAGMITESTHSYKLSMLLSGLILLAAVPLLWLARNKAYSG